MATIAEVWDSDVDGSTLRAGFNGGGRDSAGGASPRDALSVKFSTSQKCLKEEDVMFTREDVSFCPGGPTWSMYAVCDGHTGVTAANYVRDNMAPVLGTLLPEEPLPPYGSKEFEAFTYDVGTALVEAFVRIGQDFLEDNPNDISGSTVTVALLCGRLLTVANVGDSEAVVDTGTESFLATACHRVEANLGERERLTSNGVRVGRLTPSLTHVAAPGERGVGPLRCWPGGLAVSRSIGDSEAGEHVLTCPNVFQVVLPKSGARVILGSDGLWDLMPWEDAVRLVRRTPVSKAASRVLTQALFQHNWCFTDDTSVLVLDALPPRRGDFPALVKEKERRRRASSRNGEGCGGGFSACFCGGGGKGMAEELGEAEEDQHEVLAAIDGWDLLRDAEEMSPNDSVSSLTGVTGADQLNSTALEVRLPARGALGREHTPSLNGAWRKMTGGAFASEVAEPESKAVLDPFESPQESMAWLMSFRDSHAGPDSPPGWTAGKRGGKHADEASLEHWMRGQHKPPRTPATARLR